MCGRFIFELEVKSLVSRKHSYPTVDWLDVAMALIAFEAINQVKITVEMSVRDGGPSGEMDMTLWAWDRKGVSSDRKLLASVNVTCSGTGAKSLEAALFQALYGLDAKLAEGEFASVISK